MIRCCWGPMNQSYREVTLKANRGLRYSAARDMSAVLRAVLPAAAEFAATARPDMAKKDGPLSEVAGKYALCLTARNSALDVLADGFAPLLESKEEAEAFALFSASFALNLLVYMLCIPHLADTVGDLHPDMVEKVLVGISRGANWRVTDSKWNPLNWIKRRLRRRELCRLLASGTLPEAPWVTDFVQQKGAGLVWDLLQTLIDDGGILKDDLKERLSEGGLLANAVKAHSEEPTSDAEPDPETEN